METHDPHSVSNAVGTPIAVGTVTISNILAWGSSFDIGVATTAVTSIGGAILGLAWGYYTRIVPAQIENEKKRDEARKASFAGAMEALTAKLDDARERNEAERLVADAAERRAEILQATLDDVRDEVAKGNARTEDANRHLHAVRNKLEGSELRARLAEKKLNLLLDGVRKNGNLTEEAKQSILGVLDEAHRAADAVVEKAEKVVAKVDEISGKVEALSQSNPGD